MNSIPKVIHYCWFGGNPLPEMALKCIESWKKFLPDYEIKEWNEKNFDLNICEYVKEAYQAKKWAFVSDYARFWILYHEGGVYFDTDVEVIKPFEDIIENGAFMGCEVTERKKKLNTDIAVNPGLGLGAPAGLSLYKEILEFCEKYNILKNRKPLMAVPTNYPSLSEVELQNAGINIIVYANQLLRASYSAMLETANSILKYRRALEADEKYIKALDLINLIKGN